MWMDASKRISRESTDKENRFKTKIQLNVRKKSQHSHARQGVWTHSVEELVRRFHTGEHSWRACSNEQHAPEAFETNY